MGGRFLFLACTAHVARIEFRQNPVARLCRCGPHLAQHAAQLFPFYVYGSYNRHCDGTQHVALSPTGVAEDVRAPALPAARHSLFRFGSDSLAFGASPGGRTYCSRHVLAIFPQVRWGSGTRAAMRTQNKRAPLANSKKEE